MQRLTEITLDPNGPDVPLAPGERVLWTGQPAYGTGFFQPPHRETTWHILLFLCAIAAWAALLGGGGSFAQPERIGAAVILSVCLVALSSVTASNRQAGMRSLRYALTERRALIAHIPAAWLGGRRRTLLSVPLPRIAAEVRLHRSGTASVRLTTASHREGITRLPLAVPMPERAPEHIAFLHLTDADDVARLIRSAQNSDS
ncbi:MAG: hypothetical protein AAGF60_04545 [Pseudomonadota bacterium]